ncbi:MAG: cphA [Mucilaginibacter sp.]|nr:cphA [Mucilaginibacter sp.]
MHSPEYIKLISEEASSLGIEVNFFTGNWAIQLSKSGIKKFIVGYTFPLNDSACYKMIRNKNLCSEILTANNVPNVPHQLMFSPAVLEKRKSVAGNFKIIQQFITENGFPILIKKNNSTKGEGVYLLNSEPELETALSKVYATDITFCLSPFRKNIREYRNVVLDGKCLLSYEKQIPFVVGDGKSSLIALLSDYVKDNKDIISKSGKLFDSSLTKRFTEIPFADEKIFLQWNHNRLLGTNYEIVENEEMSKLAINAAEAINARFVTVDIIHSAKIGYEVLEINASVGIHFTFSPISSPSYAKAAEIFRFALKETFNLK